MVVNVHLIYTICYRINYVWKDNKMEKPQLRIPEIEEMLELGAAKATPAMAVMGADIYRGYCLSWSMSYGGCGYVRCVGYEGW